MPLFLFIFFIFYTIHTVQSSNHIHTIHSPRPLSISSSLVAQWERPPCGAEPGIELGPAAHMFIVRTSELWNPRFMYCMVYIAVTLFGEGLSGIIIWGRVDTPTPPPPSPTLHYYNPTDSLP
jgi:hypothetical protein